MIEIQGRSSKDVFSLRKTGKLKDAIELARGLFKADSSDEWIIRAYAWTLISLIWEHRENPEVTKYVRELNNLPSIEDELLAEKRKTAISIADPISREISQVIQISKDGNHTKKQFLEIMNRSSKISWKKNSGHRYFCEAHLKALKCKSCKQKKNITKYQNRQMRKNPKYEPSKKVFSKQMRIISRCIRCADNNNETCNLKDFIKWSGAIIGKCDNI